jgi:hypothetical protein
MERQIPRTKPTGMITAKYNLVRSLPTRLAGVNLGPNAAELGRKRGTATQNKAKRTNEIDFISRLCKQGVTGSTPVTSTIFSKT